MERIEIVVARECLREVTPVLGLANYPAAAAALTTIDASIPAARATQYIMNQSMPKDMEEKISLAALVLMHTNIQKIVDFYVDQKNLETAFYISNIINKYSTISDRHGYFPDMGLQIFENWRRPFLSGRNVLSSGAYQIFRRYKPTRSQRETSSSSGGIDYNDPLNHTLVAEMAFFDFSLMRCVLVTCEKHVYWGTMYINHQEMLYILLQRPSAAVSRGIHQRFIAAKIPQMMPSFFSGLIMKTGDMTQRPVSSECLFHLLSEEQHQPVHRALQALSNQSWSPVDISDHSAIADYIIEFPQPGQRDRPRRTKFVRDFPLFADLATVNALGTSLMSEPLRPPTHEEMASKIDLHDFPVFRHSQQIEESI